MNNSEVKKLLLYITVVSIVFLFILLIFIYKLDKYYKNEVINVYAKVSNGVIKVYPELEDEIIDSLMSDNNDKTILEKYGINNKINILDTKKIYIEIIIIYLLVIIVISTIYIIHNIYVFKKIKGLSIYTTKILNDDYSMDIRSYDEGDISNLKNDLYKMTIKLKETRDIELKEKKYLETTLEDISHQLRTPLTSMNVGLEVLSGNVDAITKKEFIQMEKKNLDRIEWLVTSLLKMSRLDSGTVLLVDKKEDLSKIIDNALEPIKIPIELKGISLINEVDKNLKIKVDENWVREAFINVLKNAYEHTNSLIKIVSSDNPIYTEVKIIDDGAGISNTDLPHIFERFYKGSTNKESIGIGLNMAKKIIEKENGNISVQTSNNGTTFIIKFYKFNM
ncbi:MAG: HAMP domain-containing histidine kinase [Bacillales bacterium]|nr:HAMP domain-containing histidine kinase [Bacillales bacterium]